MHQTLQLCPWPCVHCVRRPPTLETVIAIYYSYPQFNVHCVHCSLVYVVSRIVQGKRVACVCRREVVEGPWSAVSSHLRSEMMHKGGCVHLQGCSVSQKQRAASRTNIEHKAVTLTRSLHNDKSVWIHGASMCARSCVIESHYWWGIILAIRHTAVDISLQLLLPWHRCIGDVTDAEEDNDDVAVDDVIIMRI